MIHVSLIQCEITVHAVFLYPFLVIVFVLMHLVFNESTLSVLSCTVSEVAIVICEKLTTNKIFYSIL